jgi:multiple sugar transport system permease protein
MANTLSPATAELAGTAPPRLREKQGVRWGRIAAWAVMGLILLVSLFPFWWMLRTALSTNSDLVTGNQSLLPVHPTLLNLKQVLGLASAKELAAAGTQTSVDVNFFLALRNSIVVATLITLGQVTFCAMAAYAFARLRFPGRDKIFFLFLTAMNSFPGIVAPFFLMTPFAVFFLRQFFLGISKEVEEAALLDGAGRWKIFRQLIIPMSAAPLITLAVLTYITAWQEYMWPLVTGDSEHVRVLTVALNAFKSSTPTTAPPWGPLMAATFLAAVPLIVLFLAMAKRMVDAIGFSGIK